MSNEKTTPKKKVTPPTQTWHVLDAEGQILGRLAVKAAHLLQGKHKPIYAPHLDCGDGVIIVNATKFKVTGNKLQQKLYQSYSGYPSGLKKEPLESLLSRRPTEAMRKAVKGMLPKNRLGAQQITRLRLYVEAKHPHTAQTQGVKIS